MAKPRSLANAIEAAPGVVASRRDLLKVVPVAGIAAAAMATIPSAASATEAPDPKAISYDENDHVRRFYALARR